MTLLVPPLPSAPQVGSAGDIPGRLTEQDTDRLRQVATELEANFLSEMLKHSGLGQMPEGFGGGIGEEQFASFLRQEQAQSMANRGGIGLAESIFETLVRRAEAER